MAKAKKIVRTRNIYKKRRSPNRAIKIVLFILLVALLVGFGFIVMREWSLRFGKDAPKNTSSLTQSSSMPSSSDTSSDTSSNKTTPTSTNGKSKHISAADLMANSATFAQDVAKYKTQGYTAVSIELKATDGMLSFKTTNEMAVKYGAVSAKAVDLMATVKAITDAGLTPIARLSALKDPKSSHVRNENSYGFAKSPSVNWLDNSVDKGGKSWLNPYMDNTRLYINGLVSEISKAGIKTIILDNVMFPDKNTGSMNTIKTSPTRPEILKQLLDEAQAAAGEECTVYQGVDAAVFYGLNDKGGESGAGAGGYKNIAPIINFEKYGKITLNDNKLKIDTKGFIVENDAQNTADVFLAKVVEVVGKDANILPIFREGKFKGATEKSITVLEKYKLTSYIVE